MDNDTFKTFIETYVDEAVTLMGGLAHVRDLHSQLPEHTVYFVTGMVNGIVAKLGFQKAPWRDRHPDNKPVVLNQEEIRRLLDFVHLRLETGSTTS